MRSGVGQAIAPAEKPCGNAQAISGGNPESPGLRQYTCHPGFITRRRPTVKGFPDAIAAGSATRLARTRSRGVFKACACPNVTEASSRARERADRAIMALG